MDEFVVLTLPAEFEPRDCHSWVSRCVRILKKSDLELDGSGYLTLNLEGKAFFAAVASEAERQGKKLRLSHFSPEIREELAKIRKIDIPKSEVKESAGTLELIGGAGFAVCGTMKTLFYLLSECIYWTFIGRFDKHRLPFGGVSKHLLRLGSEAAGIVFLLVFLIGFTLSLQSATQLNTFGAGEYLSVGVGFLMFAELGPMLTSIILAGRSGSSITAEIASMNVAEEIKALRTMGINPIQYLIVPRFKAMTIAVPLLSFVASIIGCVAGFLVAFWFCEISPRNYWEGLRTSMPLILLFKSVIKSMVFGWIVTLIACHRGFKASGGADAVGKATTVCVVYSIAGIILADALFSFVFY
ncbi:phospholipid/cholesterol/gamma-HCH transport system permease protein [Fibrobacter sp. UWEL]|nr:phospholipid/cholesterol/gamma-HCH transport system permease protein [Fibrobacter sp. UWEL]